MDVGLIGGATTHSSYEDGDLTVWIEGGKGVELDLGTRMIPQMQLPSSLSSILNHSDIRNNIRLEYSLPAPLLGFIPIRGTIAGDQLLFDTTNNLVYANLDQSLNLTLIGLYKFKFIIDIEGLNMRIPADSYQFKMVVDKGIVNLDLLDFRGNLTTLDFGYLPEDYDEPSNPDEPGQSTTDSDQTEVSVAFLPPVDSSPPILDPENPSEEITNPEDEPSGETGDLTLDYVPSFSFPTREVAHENIEVRMDRKKPFIQVSDRTNSNAGWIVTAQLSYFRNVDSNSNSLLGATLLLENGITSSPIDVSEEPFVYQDIELHSSGDAKPIMYAEPGAGSGTWLARWYDSDLEGNSNGDVYLNVPQGSAQVGRQEATITWTIQNTPNVSE
ncbi:WxL domain-containing protein [Aerococcus urinaeequi]|uniref:WxL domain-containing protein n=1 Tax=Aerococcus urinaeequi TaxID=51665 RepID=UPI00130E9E55|nr:WxL domain-containing protein [Aerococcus urinaeequi]